MRAERVLVLLAGLCALLWSSRAAAQDHSFHPLSDPFVATSRAANDQLEPWVSATDRGAFVVAYSQGDIFFRRFAADGTPLAADELANPNINSFTQDETNVAVDPITGDFVVCWSDRGGPDGEDGIAVVGRFFRADGTPYGDEFILSGVPGQNQPKPGSQFGPRAAWSVNGRVLIVWSDTGQDGATGVFARLFDRDGTPLGDEFLVNPPSADNQVRPAVAASRDGRFVVVYEDANFSHPNADQRDIVAVLLDDQGAFLTAPILVNDYQIDENTNLTAGDQKIPQVAADGDGDFVVVWRDEAGHDGDGLGVWGRLFLRDGTPAGAPFTLGETTAGNQSSPNVSMDFVGNFVAVWESDHGGDSDVYLRRFDRNGLPLTGETLVHDPSPLAEETPRVAVTQSGERTIVVWHVDDGQNQGDTYARRYGQDALVASGQPALTETVTIDVEVPGQALANYVLLPSLGSQPALGVEPGGRSVDVAPDALMDLALAQPEGGLFSGILGTLDPQGRAQATFTVPNLVEFYGQEVRFALVTLDGSMSGQWDLSTGEIQGVAFLSDPLVVEVQGPKRFFFGQTLEGTLANDKDEDRASFEALKGEKVKFLIDVPEGAASELVVEVRNAADEVVKSWTRTVPPPSKKKGKLKLKIPASGTYFLVVKASTDSGVSGAYRLNTRHKVKKSAEQQVKKVKVGKSGQAEVKIQAIAGAALDVTVKPLSSSAPTAVELVQPDGNALLLAQGGGAPTKIEVQDVTLTQTGKHFVRVTATKGSKYKVKIVPEAPLDGTVIIE